MHGASLNYEAPIVTSRGIESWNRLDDIARIVNMPTFANSADDRLPLDQLTTQEIRDLQPWKTKNGHRWFGAIKSILSGFAQAIPLISHSMNIGDKVDKWFG